MAGGELTESKSFLSRLAHGIVNLNAALPLYEKYLAELIDDKKIRQRFFAAIILLFCRRGGPADNRHR